MIEFKIVSSPDKTQQATYQHLGEELIVGNSGGNMIVDDPAFGPVQLRVVVRKDKTATIENLNPSVEVRLNGKAVSGVSPLKEKDNVTVARTTINFSRLDNGQLNPPDPYELPNFKERFIVGSKEWSVLEALKYLETAQTTSSPAKPPPPRSAQPPLPGIPMPKASPQRETGNIKPPPPPLPKKS